MVAAAAAGKCNPDRRGSKLVGDKRDFSLGLCSLRAQPIT